LIVDAVDVYWLPAGGVCHFLASHYEKLASNTKFSIKISDIGQPIVISNHDKVVAEILVITGYIQR